MKILYVFCPLILLLSAACASGPGVREDYSSPSRALLGEWKMTDGSGLVSFSPDGTYNFIDPAGGRGKALYSVLEEDDGKRTISTLIRLVEFEGELVEEEAELKVEGRFSPNYQVFVGEVIDEEGLPSGSFRMER